jgi:hypothetical protein
MRGIYLIIGVILIGLAFWAGYTIGHPDMDTDESELMALDRKYDSLSGELAASKRRESWYIDQAQKDILEIEALQAGLASRERSHQKSQSRYGTRIKEIENYSLDRLDSFLIDMYPRPGVRKLRYNPDGTVRQQRQDPEVEIENDRSAGNPIRLTDERVRKALEGQQGFEAYCGEIETRDENVEWEIVGEGSARIDLTAANNHTESEGGLLDGQREGIQTAAESGSDPWNIGFGSGNLFLP